MSTNKNESNTANTAAKPSTDVKNKNTVSASQGKDSKEATPVRFTSRRVWQIGRAHV